ncbi:hypothetical protein [Vallicoccus soli]|uniref:eRF1 domain-containing protein n=1 Tax=Vallicoccus soli TaxID=2339232 RepID=A0A3A3Z6Q6_9ACTN|nr:hypothetical protein [Vallicoccus soli]RJK97607.1 hypothetical protein D5H78_00805 [Vallicoccus soli]
MTSPVTSPVTSAVTGPPDEPAAPAAGPSTPVRPAGRARRPRVPSPAQVSALQAVRGRPCVSLLCSTTPGQRMAPADAARLRALAAQAVRRVAAEGRDDADAVLDRLGQLVPEAVAGPVDAAVAVFASARIGQVVHLPVPVADRAVVDRSFATRDLVRALHRTPRHVVLVLSADEARLFDGVGGTLQPAVRSGFPLRARDVLPAPRDGRADGRGDRGGRRPADAATAAFLRAVDRVLVAYLRLHPAPLVLVGPERLVAALRLTTRATRVAGAVTGARPGAPLPELARLVRPVLDAYLHSRQAEALALLERRTGQHRAVSGLEDCWFAARRERPEMLAVEDTLARAARLGPDGDVLLPVDDPSSPDVLEDAVDELIELVLERGGWVALVEEGALAGRGGVALSLRTR